MIEQQFNMLGVDNKTRIQTEFVCLYHLVLCVSSLFYLSRSLSPNIFYLLCVFGCQIENGTRRSSQEKNEIESKYHKPNRNLQK